MNILQIKSYSFHRYTEFSANTKKRIHVPRAGLVLDYFASQARPATLTPHTVWRLTAEVSVLSIQPSCCERQPNITTGLLRMRGLINCLRLQRTRYKTDCGNRSNALLCALPKLPQFPPTVLTNFLSNRLWLGKILELVVKHGV